MAKTTFASTNRRVDESKFPKLKLEVGEHARIVVIEKDPEFMWVHSLRAPKIMNGRAVIKTRDTKNGPVEEVDHDFMGNAKCFGDDGLLFDKGMDAKNCPMCARAQESDEISKPIRRFAVHVLKYSTQPGSFELNASFNVQLLIWAFTEKKYNKLIGFQEEFGPLLNHDLLLGPCTPPEMFQNFDISISGKAEWKASEDRKKFSVELYKNNRVSDETLEGICGSKRSKSSVLEAIETIRDRWQVVNGEPSGNDFQEAAADVASEPSLDDGIADLLTSQTGAPAPVEPSSIEDVNDFETAASEPAVADDTVDVSPAEEKAPEEKKAGPGSGGDVEWDSLLNM